MERASTGLCWTATCVPWARSPAGSSQDRRTQGQAPFPARFDRPDGTLNSRGPRGLQVRHNDIPRAHQVDGDSSAKVQSQRSQLLSGIRTICGDPSGFRIERVRVDEGGEFKSKELQGYCLKTGVSLEYASTSTPQQIGMSERVGKILQIW